MRHKALLFNKTSSNKDDVFSITTNAPCGCTNYGCFRSKHCALVIVFVTLSIASFSRNAFVLRPVMFPTRQSPVSHEHPQIEFRVVKDNCSNNKNSTELLHHSTDRMFYGPFSHLRAGLDYNYHKNFNEQRQNVQDQILIHFLQKQMQQQQQQGESSMDSAQGSNSSDCTSEIKRPILVFTAGCMGSGKTHTLHALYHQGRFPLTQFLTVDPDEIRRHLPEFSEFVQCHPELAGHLTRKEAGYISELLTLAALERQHNVVIDGSLRDSDWYVVYFSKMRELYPTLYIAILHILAPRDVVYQRAKVIIYSYSSTPANKFLLILLLPLLFFVSYHVSYSDVNNF